jgi:hypothetical protein
MVLIDPGCQGRSSTYILLDQILFLIQLLRLFFLQYVVRDQQFWLKLNEFLVENDLIHFVERLDVDHV